MENEGRVWWCSTHKMWLFCTCWDKQSIENGWYLKFIRKHWLTRICSVVVDISVFQIRAGLASSSVLHIQHSFGVSGQWFSEETMHQCQASERQWVSLVPTGIIGFNLQTLKTAAPTEFHPPKASARAAWITKHSLSQHAVRNATGHGNSAIAEKQGEWDLTFQSW